MKRRGFIATIAGLTALPLFGKQRKDRTFESIGNGKIYDENGREVDADWLKIYDAEGKCISDIDHHLLKVNLDTGESEWLLVTPSDIEASGRQVLNDWPATPYLIEPQEDTAGTCHPFGYRMYRAKVYFRGPLTCTKKHFTKETLRVISKEANDKYVKYLDVLKEAEARKANG